MRPLQLLLSPLLPLLALMAVLPSPAAAAVAHWSHRQVTYRDATPEPDRAAVRQAVRMWNALPVNVRLVPARAGDAADVTVRHADYGTTPWAGLTSWTSNAHRAIERATVHLNDHWTAGELPVERLDVVAHELGHALGLRHIPGCAVMNPSGLPERRCRQGAPSGQVACGPQGSDLHALARMYGRLRGRSFHPTFCPDPHTTATPTPAPPNPAPPAAG